MDITGLTGHSGSGKTTVAEMMAELGFYHIDCDKIVHEKVYADKCVIDKIFKAFGEKYVLGGVLNRRELGKLVFSDKTAYNKLVETVSPYIEKALYAELETAKNKKILLDAPALFEYGMEDLCDRIIAVISDHAIERICKRDKITQAEAKNRLNSQMDVEFYKQHCDIIIENNSDLSELRQKVKTIATNILEEKYN